MSEALISELPYPLFLFLTTFVTEDGAYWMGLTALQLNTISPLSFVGFYTLGVLLGDLGLFFVGRFSIALMRLRETPFLGPMVRRLPQPKAAGLNVTEFGGLEQFLVVTRFLPGSRIPTYLYCGYNGYPVWAFFLILAVTTLIYAGVGSILSLFVAQLSPQGLGWKWQALLALGVTVFVILVMRFLVRVYKDLTQFGEVLRPMALRLERKLSSEFWSPRMFYYPFVPYFCGLLARYGGFHGVLQCNPSMYLSGLVGEKKSEIDDLIREHLPQHALKLKALPHSDAEAKELIQREFSYPVVVKPDSGMRGWDVNVIKSEYELESLSFRRSWVAQELSPHANEWGVFYVRYPGEKQGRLFSITNKQLPKVIGDGQKNLYQLVLSDQYLRLRVDDIFSGSEHRANEVLPVGEERYLGHRASHSKGCLFFDGAEFLQSAAARHIAEAFDRIPEFYVGRADIRFSSLEELQAGEFQVIEINGAGAESTNFYDPKYSVWDRYRIVAEQWRLIFEIGDRSKKWKAKSPSLFQFLIEAFCYRWGWSS